MKNYLVTLRNGDTATIEAHDEVHAWEKATSMWPSTLIIGLCEEIHINGTNLNLDVLSAS